MKQDKKCKLLWISIVFYIINIANILLSIQLFLNGENAYFIAFWSLFGIDKVITFLFSVIGKGINGFIFWITDIFQLGFIFIFFSKQIQFSFEGALMTKLFTRIFPLIISELIIFFGCGFLLRQDVDIYLQILAYVNYVLFLALAIVILTIISLQFQNKHLCLLQYLLTVCSYYFTLSSLLQFKDCFGVSLGYYYLSFLFINAAIFFIATPPHEIKSVYFENVFSQFFGNTLLNSYFNQTDIEASNKTALIKCTTIVSYLNQLVRITLLLVYSYAFYVNSFKNILDLNGIDIICFINLILSVITSTAYLIYYFKKVIQQVFCVKILLIRNIKQIQSSINYLQKPNKYLKALYIQIYDSTSEVQPKLQQLLPKEGFCTELCYYSHKFQVLLGQQLANNINIFDNGSTKISCDCFLMKLVSEEQYILNSLQNEISYRFQNITSIFNNLIFQRYINGFLSTQYTQKLQKQNADLFDLSPLKYLRSQLYSINVYFKVFQEFMTYSPQMIIYDLYE